MSRRIDDKLKMGACVLKKPSTWVKPQTIEVTQDLVYVVSIDVNNLPVDAPESLSTPALKLSWNVFSCSSWNNSQKPTPSQDFFDSITAWTVFTFRLRIRSFILMMIVSHWRCGFNASMRPWIFVDSETLSPRGFDRSTSWLQRKYCRMFSDLTQWAGARSFITQPAGIDHAFSVL